MAATATATPAATPAAHAAAQPTEVQVAQPAAAATNPAAHAAAAGNPVAANAAAPAAMPADPNAANAGAPAAAPGAPGQGGPGPGEPAGGTTPGAELQKGTFDYPFQKLMAMAKAGNFVDANDIIVDRAAKGLASELLKGDLTPAKLESLKDMLGDLKPFSRRNAGGGVQVTLQNGKSQYVQVIIVKDGKDFKIKDIQVRDGKPR